MRRIGNLQTPMLNTNAPQMQFGQFLMNNAQQGLEFNEQKRQNEANNIHKQRALLQQDKQFNKTFGLNEQKFDETKKQNEIGNSQWQQGYDLNKNKFGYTKMWDRYTHDYKVDQDAIDNKLKQQQINISSQKANKPNSLEQLLMLSMGVVPGTNKTTVPTPTTATPLEKEKTTPAVMEVGYSDKPQTPIDILTSKNNQKLKDEKGNEWEYNPITKRKTLVTKAKKPTLNMNDVDDINSAIEVFNNLQYAKTNWKPQYTGFLDDKVNLIRNEVGQTGPEVEDYNRWAAALQSVANKARNKSFGAALSSFDIGEFAKEFPATDGGDGTIIPKLEARINMLKGSLSNTYKAWVDKYGKETADRYFSNLQDKSIIGSAVPTNEYSDEDILKVLGAR